jgi:histone H3/H4
MGITKPAIRRLARRGGVKRMALSVFETIRDFMCGAIQRLTEGSIYTC